MRPKYIVLITVMTLLTSLLSSLPKMSARQQNISQTGNISAVAAVPTYTPVPTVLAHPVNSSYTAAPTAVPTIEDVAPVAPAIEIENTNDALNSFVQTVANGSPNQVVGVYVDNVLALPIVQQPSDNPNFVSTQPETITQFAAAGRFKTIGLLAHNYLAGTHFTDLQKDQVVTVVYGDGSLKYYRVSKVERYQALSPESPQSDFIDLNNGLNTRMSAGDVFGRIYTQGDVVVFQTCILNNGDPSWGRLFITATPIPAPVSYAVPASNWINAWM